MTHEYGSIGEKMPPTAKKQARPTRPTRARRRGGVEPPDVKRQYAQAKALLEAGKLDEATTAFVWLWQHMLEHNRSMRGVRVSFMAGLLQTLTKRHAPARKRFRLLRDELTAVVDSGMPGAGQLQDWAVLCGVVGESRRVLQWFDRMGPSYDPPPEHGWVMQYYVIPLLKSRGRWADIGRLYPEPLRLLRSTYEMVADIPRLTSTHPENAAAIRTSIEQGFLADIGTMYASLRAAGRDVDAQRVLEEARKLMPGNSLEEAIADALKEAGNANPVARRDARRKRK